MYLCVSSLSLYKQLQVLYMRLAAKIQSFLTINKHYHFKIKTYKPIRVSLGFDYYHKNNNKNNNNNNNNTFNLAKKSGITVNLFKLFFKSLNNQHSISNMFQNSLLSRVESYKTFIMLRISSFSLFFQSDKFNFSI